LCDSTAAIPRAAPARVGGRNHLPSCDRLSHPWIALGGFGAHIDGDSRRILVETFLGGRDNFIASVEDDRTRTLTQAHSFGPQRVLTGTVILVCPGGLEHNGGIGRQMGYFLQARRFREDGLVYEIVDSRGPWFLGASPLHTIFAGFYLVGALLKMLTMRLRAMPCIVHVNITGRGSTVRKVVLVTFMRAVGLRYLLHVHDYDYAKEYNKRGRLMRLLIRSIFRSAERVLVLGMRDRQALQRLLQLRQIRIVVLHNAVPDPQPDLTRVRDPETPCHLLFLGHLSERKGVPELLQALAGPALMARHWRATLAGGGPIDEFRRRADDLGIASRVEFPGWLDEVRVGALCADADVLVLPSHAEGLAMAVLEGLSYGLSVITTPVGAHPEVMEQDVSGILIPPGDVEALARALARVIEDKGLRERLRVGARRRFLEKFDLHSYAERLGQLHADMLSTQHVEALGEEQASR
jgi:glycosyltransferase involved in cell wall biosynthesis